MRILTILIILVANLMAVFSCSETSEGSGKSLVNFRLIDAPGDFDEAWIGIRGVEVLQGRSRGATDAHWIFIEYQQANQQVDISKLVADGVLLIGRSEIPIGTISKIRLLLGEDHYLIKNGERLSLTLNTGAEIEIDVEYRLEDSFSYDVYLDFDLDKSIQKTSDTTQFLLSPVVRSFVRYETSEIGGKIRPVEARPVLYAIQGSDTISTLTNSRGEYTFMGLKEGKHTLLILPRKPYLDTIFQAETEKGKLTAIEEIILRVPILK